LSDDGYLADPEAKYWRALNPDLVALSTLRELRCLVLLGEPGIGKSTAVDEDYADLTRAGAPLGAKCVRFDLRSYGSEDRIVQTVFEGEAFRGWRKDASLLYLYLDSLDECTVRVANVAALLGEQLERVPHQRLRLRIACRKTAGDEVMVALVNARIPGHGDCGRKASP